MKNKEIKWSALKGAEPLPALKTLYVTIHDRDDDKDFRLDQISETQYKLTEVASGKEH